ncbi:MAG TPA: HPr(Ser) kinase/phosphatase [Candidatus Cloacimonetes bacterium]|nr:HPr(Ser) kinase/phosphatase [Candidatus Cloacimonadota bacterium]
MKEISVKKFFRNKEKDFSLSVITNPKTLENKITGPYLNKPGLAFAGYLERFSYKRIQILGETEISYLQSLKDEEIYDRVKDVLVYEIPCFIITKGLSVPEQVIFLADEMNVAILSSRLSTDKLFNALRKYLGVVFAPSKTIHGTLIDVFGVGIMLTGKSGIGKSECALDLVERGHRLITDDVVKITYKDDVLMGTSTNDYGHFMEIRGVGLIDVEKMFGIQAVRIQKRIEVQVELMPWRDNMDYERIGLSNNFTDILEVKIPVIYLPVSPGKNVSVIIEVVAMNHISKTFGYDAAKVYTKRLQDDLKRKAQINNKLIDDKE